MSNDNEKEELRKLMGDKKELEELLIEAEERLKVMQEEAKKKGLEYVGKCKICGKEHFRGDGKAHLEWYYHESVGVVCRDHEGVEEWYKELLEKLHEDSERLFM